jgi:hypothetical protein
MNRSTERIERRMGDIRAWLLEQAPECFEQQRHLEDGTGERIYWHYGYMIALRDILGLLDDHARQDGHAG